MLAQGSGMRSGGGRTLPSQFYTYKNEVPLLPGQQLGFLRGNGYYAMGQAAGPAVGNSMPVAPQGSMPQHSFDPAIIAALQAARGQQPGSASPEMLQRIMALLQSQPMQAQYGGPMNGAFIDRAYDTPPQFFGRGMQNPGRNNVLPGPVYY